MIPRTPIARKRTKPRRTSALLLHSEAYESFREAIWTRDNHRCVWCNRWVPLDSDDPFKKMDLMHWPRTRPHGGDVMENAVCSCHRCHMAAHNGKTMIRYDARKDG